MSIKGDGELENAPEKLGHRTKLIAESNEKSVALAKTPVCFHQDGEIRAISKSYITDFFI